MGKGIKKVETIENVSIYYEFFPNLSANDKPLLVFIHGFLSSSFCYRKLIPLLQKDFSILNIDIPPFGESDKRKNVLYSYTHMAFIVKSLIKKLKYSKAILIGHSMGGQIALYAAKNFPELIDQLVLLCSSSYLPKTKKSLRFATYLPFSTSWIKRRLASQGVSHNLLTCVHDHTLIDEEMIQGYEKPFKNKEIFHALKKFARDREGDLQKSELQQILTPTLLLWGEKDKVVPLHKGETLHKDLPNSKLIVYPNTGHLLPEEKPDQVKEDIIVFLNERLS